MWCTLLKVSETLSQDSRATAKGTEQIPRLQYEAPDAESLCGRRKAVCRPFASKRQIESGPKILRGHLLSGRQNAVDCRSKHFQKETVAFRCPTQPRLAVGSTDRERRTKLCCVVQLVHIVYCCTLTLTPRLTVEGTAHSNVGGNLFFLPDSKQQIQDSTETSYRS